MVERYEYPQPFTGPEEEQIRQIRRYLYKLVDDLNGNTAQSDETITRYITGQVKAMRQVSQNKYLNCNAMTETGSYVVSINKSNGFTNYPTDLDGVSFLLQVKASEGFVYQIIIMPAKLYVRCSESGIWSPWCSYTGTLAN